MSDISEKKAILADLLVDLDSDFPCNDKFSTYLNVYNDLLKAAQQGTDDEGPINAQWFVNDMLIFLNVISLMTLMFCEMFFLIIVMNCKFQNCDLF